MSTTIRVNEATRDRLASIAANEQRSITAVVDEAVDALERRRFFAAFRERYDELRNDPEEWQSIESERALESSAIRDADL